MWQRVYMVAMFILTKAINMSLVSCSFTLSGCKKDSWPELLNAQLGDAILTLNSSGLVENVYVQIPSSGAPPTNIGSVTDVWLYTNGSIVYEIPQRGVWHPNRVGPGWPDVAGKHYKDAISKIKQDISGMTIVYGPKGFLRLDSFKIDRVQLDLNKDGTVAGVPSIG